MTEDEEKVAMYQLHQACQELIMEANAIQRILWASVYEKRSPDFNKVAQAAGEAGRRALVLCKMAEEMRIQGLEIDAG